MWLKNGFCLETENWVCQRLSCRLCRWNCHPVNKQSSKFWQRMSSAFMWLHEILSYCLVCTSSSLLFPCGFASPHNLDTTKERQLCCIQLYIIFILVILFCKYMILNPVICSGKRNCPYEEEIFFLISFWFVLFKYPFILVVLVLSNV